VDTIEQIYKEPHTKTSRFFKRVAISSVLVWIVFVILLIFSIGDFAGTNNDLFVAPLYCFFASLVLCYLFKK